jgi:hypothetical protein
MPVARCRAALLATALFVTCLAPAAPAAAVGVVVGMGDQSPAMFADPHWQALGLKRARYFIRWDAMDVPAAYRAAASWVFQARRRGVTPSLFLTTNDFTPGKAKLPSKETYDRQVRRLIAYFKPRGVSEWGAWNEANHRSEPTSRSPTRMAEYFHVLRKRCSRCTVVGLDVLDQGGVENYIARFFAALSSSDRQKATVVGIHNYPDDNRFRTSGTRTIIKVTHRRQPHAKFWITEGGGIVNFGSDFPCNEHRAAKAVTQTFTVARTFDAQITRLYLYNWTGNNCQGFDTGLTRADGSLREGYASLRKQLPSFRR